MPETSPRAVINEGVRGYLSRILSEPLSPETPQRAYQVGEQTTIPGFENDVSPETPGAQFRRGRFTFPETPGLQRAANSEGSARMVELARQVLAGETPDLPPSPIQTSFFNHEG